MPAKSVVFHELKKFYGKYTRFLKTSDCSQLAGRAGRRGIDKVGFVFCRINLNKIKPDVVKDIVFGKSEEVKSQFNLSYATILNLYERYQDKLIEVYPLSLHYFQSKKYEQKDALRLLQAKINLLKELNYIKDNILTPKAKFAQNIYGYELILSELYEEQVLEQLDEFDLGILSVAVVFEPRKNQILPKLSKRTRKIKYICEEFYSHIKQKEQKYRIYPFSKPFYFNLSPAVEGWLSGTSFQKIKLLTDTDEGEIVRYFRMAVQILREIQDAQGISYILKNKVKDTLHVLNRDIIDAEKQLRESS
ncbi:MAG: hypothetical protein N2Z79_04510 [Candidatus Omnitrophica bacterium]|nr:hypothetical protein [Candidatus Omnitrophota bacterium]